MERAFKSTVYNITVKWSKPQPYDQALEALNSTTKDVFVTMNHESYYYMMSRANIY